MKCAFLTHYPMPDIRAFSGISYYLSQHLQMAGVDVEHLYAESVSPSLSFKLRRKIYKKAFGWGMREDRNPAQLRAMARQLESKMKGKYYDFIFTSGSLALAYLCPNRPAFFWSDATFDSYINFIKEFSDMSPETIRDGHRAEQSSLDCASLAFYSSEWAAQSAQKHYRNVKNKVCVVPFGANLTEPPDEETVQSAILLRGKAPWKLLFLGVEWERKGGPLVLQIMHELGQMGHAVELHIVGCLPEIPVDLKERVKSWGFLDKKNSTEARQLADLLLQSHLLVLPAQAEACAVAFAEACSYGLPVVASRVGGCATVIEDGVNGYLFALGTSPRQIAECIRSIFEKKETYIQLAQGARQAYSQRLNYKTAVAIFLQKIEPYLKKVE